MIKFKVRKVGEYKNLELSIGEVFISELLNKEERKELSETLLNLVFNLVGTDFDHIGDYYDFIGENT